MRTKKRNSSNNEENEINNSDSDSDISMSDTESEVEDIAETDGYNIIGDNENNEENENVEEDDVIKAIKREAEKKRDHPPIIHCEDFVTDISFHPHEDILAVGNIVGDVILYKYTNDENVVLNQMELHTKSCRDIEFSADGAVLFSAAKDKSIMLSNCETGKLIRFYEQVHDVPVYCLSVIDENLFATGDDDGTIKLWDLRENNSNPIFKIEDNEDYISDIVTSESKHFLLCSSGDGSLTTIDLQNRKVHMQSEEYDEELTCLGLFRHETKLISGTTKGKLLLFNWNEFGLHSDEFPGAKTPINDLIPITENIVVTACEDGNLRATHLFPHRHLGIVGQHDLSIENVDICNNGQFIASNSHNNDIKFWNIQYFEDFEKICHKHKKHEKNKEMENNLPSSKIKNASDFFSGLC